MINFAFCYWILPVALILTLGFLKIWFLWVAAPETSTWFSSSTGLNAQGTWMSVGHWTHGITSWIRRRLKIEQGASLAQENEDRTIKERWEVSPVSTCPCEDGFAENWKIFDVKQSIILRACLDYFVLFPFVSGETKSKLQRESDGGMGEKANRILTDNKTRNWRIHTIVNYSVETYQ